jgi:hypothetical protein
MNVDAQSGPLRELSLGCGQRSLTSLALRTRASSGVPLTPSITAFTAFVGPLVTAKWRGKCPEACMREASQDTSSHRLRHASNAHSLGSRTDGTSRSVGRSSTRALRASTFPFDAASVIAVSPSCVTSHNQQNFRRLTRRRKTWREDLIAMAQTVQAYRTFELGVSVLGD